MADPLGETASSDPLPHGSDPPRRPGKAEAWEQFYAYCFEVVQRCPSVRKLVPSDREDCVQDVMMELVRKFGAELPETIREDHTGLIRTLSRNKAVDILRRRYSKPESPLDAGAGLPAHEAGPDRGEDVSLVWEAMLSLDQQVPVTSYLVFYLRTIEGWEVREIADLFGLSADQVRSRCHRVRTLFSEALKRRAH